MQKSPISIEKHPSNGFILTTELTIERPLKDVFNFFSNAENLEAITPPWLNFRIVSPTPIAMKAGALIDYKLQLRGLPINWRTEIESWDPPHRFVDQQLRGPYKRWFHEHTFKAIGESTTLCTDRVHYIPRFGILVHKYFVKPDLLKIFNYRQEQLRKRLSAPAPPATPPAPVGTNTGSQSSQVTA